MLKIILLFLITEASAESLKSKRRPKIFAVAYGYVRENLLIYSAKNCDLIIISPLTYPTPPKLIKACNKNIKILGYCETMSTDTRYDNFSELNKHEDWFLHDRSGRRIKVYLNKTDTRYGMDKTNEQYQNWLSEKCKKIVEGGYDGVFLDNLGTTLSYRNPFKYSGFPVSVDNEKWQKGSEKLLAKVKAVAGKDKVIVFNQIGINNDVSVFYSERKGKNAKEASISFTNFCDGAMKENFFDNGSNIGKNSFEFIDLLKLLNKKNKHTLCLARGNSKDNAKTLYCLYLLALDGENAYFSYQGDYKKVTWYDFYRIDLGLPLEDYLITDGAVGMRRFEKGIVVVNCSNKNKLINLPEVYRAKNKEKINKVFLNSKQGEILIK